MNKHWVTLSALSFGLATVHAAPVWSESFDDVAMLPASGWAMANHSTLPGPSGWFQGNTIVFDAASGSPDAYIGANYNSAAAGTISHWLLTPSLAFGDGASLSFAWRGALERPYFDRLEVYVSRAGTSADVGDFVLLQSLTTLGQTASTWRTQSIDLAALAGLEGRVGFRYTGWFDDANYIGLDDVVVTAAVAQVPEPASLALLAGGLLGLALMRRRLRA